MNSTDVFELRRPSNTFRIRKKGRIAPIYASQIQQHTKLSCRRHTKARAELSLRISNDETGNDNNCSPAVDMGGGSGGETGEGKC